MRATVCVGGDQVKKVSNDELRSEKMVQRKAIQLEGPCVKAPCAQEEQKELSLQPASCTCLPGTPFSLHDSISVSYKRLHSPESNSNTSSRKPSKICHSPILQEARISSACDLSPLPSTSLGPHLCHSIVDAVLCLIFPIRA